MSRVINGVFAAAAAILMTSGAASAGGCCAAPVGFAPVPVPLPLVPHYVVNQGPVIAGPGLTDFGPWIYYIPQPAGPFPYVGGGRQWQGYYYPGYGLTPRWRARPHRYGNPVPIPAGAGGEPVLLYR